VAYKGRLIIATICGLFMTGCTLLMAQFTNWFLAACSEKPVTDNILVNFGIAHGWFSASDARMALVWMVASLFVLIYIPKGIFAYFNNYLIASVTSRVGADLRADIYAHVQKLPLRFFHTSRIGDLMSRMSNDVFLIQNSSNVVILAIEGPITILGGLGRMFWISWQLATLTIVFVPLMGVAIDRLTKRIRPLTTLTQESLADVNATVEESITGIRIIKSFGTEAQEINRFNLVNNRNLAAALRFWRRNMLVHPTIEIMGGAATALIMSIGGWMVVNGLISFPRLGEFIMLAFIVASASKQFGRINVTYQQTIAAGARIFEIIDTEPEVSESPSGVALKDVKGLIEFKDVRFEYVEGEPVLDGISFAINPGEVVALVGPSGAGKSTVADLIPRFYDVTGGSISVEGHDIRDIKLISLREQIAMVQQETILFGGTIAQNIGYGKPSATIEEIIEVARAANAHDFIIESPNGYDTLLGEHGKGLSGGQQQRLSIARALLKNPKILILDEATSSLDAASEVVVQDALDRLMKNRSTLVIAHRLSTVKNADRIVVIDQGRVSESGSFDELMKLGGVFSQLYNTQFRFQEVADVRAD
jgi:subfamily B ATP-binding cassette protein MsbA